MTMDANKFFSCPACGHQDDDAKFVHACPMCETSAEDFEAANEWNEIDALRDE